MTPTAMAYRRPTDLDAALVLLASEGSLPLAGGTDFVPMQRSGAINPATIVDLKSLPELRRVEVRVEHVTIGGCVTMAEIGALGPAGIGALTDGANCVGGRQTRARATLAGNVARSLARGRHAGSAAGPGRGRTGGRVRARRPRDGAEQLLRRARPEPARTG